MREAQRCAASELLGKSVGSEVREHHCGMSFTSVSTILGHMVMLNVWHSVVQPPCRFASLVGAKQILSLSCRK